MGLTAHFIFTAYYDNCFLLLIIFTANDWDIIFLVQFLCIFISFRRVKSLWANNQFDLFWYSFIYVSCHVLANSNVLKRYLSTSMFILPSWTMWKISKRNTYLRMFSNLCMSKTYLENVLSLFMYTFIDVKAIHKEN